MSPAAAAPLLLVLGAVWGLLPSLAKLLIGEGVSALWIPTIAGLGASALLLGLVALRGARLPVDRAHVWHYAAVGVTGLTLANGCGYFALQHVPAGFYVLVLPLSPILTVLFSVASRAERAGPRVWLGVLAGFSGAALAMSPAAALPDPAALPWALLALATPTFYAVSNVLAMRLAPPGTPPLPLSVGTLGLGGAALMPLALAGPGGVPPTAGALAGLALLIAAMAAAYLLYFHLMAKAGAITTSLVGYTTTLFGLVWGAVIFAERPGWLVLPAAALILGGLWVTTRR